MVTRQQHRRSFNAASGKVWSECGRKESYAKKPVDVMHRAEQRGTYLRAYLCTFCEKYHLTHKDKN